MLKIISLSALLIVAQATDIKDFYGDWKAVAFYPASTYVPICIHIVVSKSTDNVQCTYADGRNVTSVQITSRADTEREQRQTVPMVVVNTPAEVMPALDLTVKCGNKTLLGGNVARLLNEEYFIFYSNIPEHMAFTRTEVEQNSAVLLAKNVVSSEKLFKVMMNIEDLKNRRGAQMCGTENYGTFGSSNNVGNL